MDLVTLGVAVAGGGLLVWRWQTHERMKKLAWELGLTFSLGADERATSFEKAAAFLGLMSGWSLSGRMNGVEVKVHKVMKGVEGVAAPGQAPTTSTYLTAFFGPPKKLGMFVTGRRKGAPGLLDKVVARLMPAERTEVQSGNAALDEKATIAGGDPEAIRSLLSQPRVQESILRAVEFDDQIAISDEGVQLVRGGNFSDPVQIRSILEMLSQTASRLQ